MNILPLALAFAFLNQESKRLVIVFAALWHISLSNQGVSHALQLLSKESSRNPSALKAAFTLMHQYIQRASNFQGLYPTERYLQQISIYVMENLMPRIWVSEFKNWSEAETVCAEVLESFYSLMEEPQSELDGGTAEVMELLKEFLPNPQTGLGWDTPLVSLLVDALSLTSQLGFIVSQLVKQAVKQKFGNSSRKALKMLEGAFRKALNVLQAPAVSHSFIALVLARELVTHSVVLVDKALENEETERRFDDILSHIVKILQLPFSLDVEEGPFEVSSEESPGGPLRVSQLPTPLASLFVVAATRRREQAYATNATVRMLFDVIARKGSGSRLRALLATCRTESETFSNAFGLSMLLPDRDVPDTQEVAQCLQDMGNENQGRSAQAVEHFVGLCKTRKNFQDLVPCLRALGEVVSLQCTAQDDDKFQEAVQIARKLPDMVLGPAGDLLRQVAEQTEWNIDFLNRNGQAAWHTSIIAHVLSVLGAAHETICHTKQAALPPAVKPFTAFNILDEAALQCTYWPGLPDDCWQSLRHSGLHKHQLVGCNMVWAECDCGFRYCYSECGAPVSSAPCQSLGRDGSCKLINGGQGHEFASGQRLIAVIVDTYTQINGAMRQKFPGAFQRPGPTPGLFSLIEADEQDSVTLADREAVSHSFPDETVRQDWNQLDRRNGSSNGLHPVTFRVLHYLIHSSALVGIEMEWKQGIKNKVHLLQEHLRKVARVNPVKTPDDTVWYLMANMEADLVALRKLLKGTVEETTLFMHAVLHRLVSLPPDEQPPDEGLTSHAARVKYETWFHQTVVMPVLGEKAANGKFELPGVKVLRRQAGQEKDPDLLLTSDLLARRGISPDVWSKMKATVRASLLPHVLRPLVFPLPQDAWEELLAGRFEILHLLMAGLQDGLWSIQLDLVRAASLAWILPFMQLVREKEGGKLTMETARRMTIHQWLEGQESHEKDNAWILFRNCEAAWEATLSSGNVRDGCGVVQLPPFSLNSPLALACPIAEPEKMRHGDIPVGHQGAKPEHIAALGLHHLAVSHNRLVARIHAYLSSGAAAHVKARLHPSAELCKSSGQCNEDVGRDQRVPLIQHASTAHLFVFPSQLETTCVGKEDNDSYGPKIFQLDYKIDCFLREFFQIPSDADPPARGDHDLEAMENNLAWRLVTARRPLQIYSEIDVEEDQQPFIPSCNRGNSLKNLRTSHAKRHFARCL